jgi:hypothetical protein
VQKWLVCLSARPARGVDDHPGALDQPETHERRKRERRSCGIAPRRCDVRGALHLVAEQLREPVCEAGQQLRAGVRLAVPLRIERGVLQAEVGGHVDHMGDLVDQIRH